MKKLLFPSWSLRLAALLVLGLLSSCTQNLFVSKKPLAPPAALAVGPDYQYKLRKDDKITLSVFDHEELSIGSIFGHYPVGENEGKWELVDAAGNLNVPRVGPYHVEGLTLLEAKNQLEKLMAKSIVNPQVTLKVLNLQATVLGEVNAPGNQHFEKEHNTLVEVLGKAGDFGVYADKRHVKVLRQNAQGTQATDAFFSNRLIMSELKQSMRALRPLWTGLPIIAACTGLSLTAAWQYLRYATPLYESTTKIKLADVNEGVLNTTLLKNLDAFSGDNRTSAEVELVRSPLLLGRALDHLSFDISAYRVGKVQTTEMYRASPFTAEMKVADLKWTEKPFDLRIDAAGGLQVTAPSGQVAQGQVGQVLRFSGAELRIGRNDSLLKARPDLGLAGHYRLVQHDRARLLDDIASRLDVTTTDHNVPVLRISFQSPVPQKAADLVNALSVVYLDDYLTMKYKVVNTAAETIGEQIKNVQRTLTHSEDTVEQYRDLKRIVNIKQETETDLHKVSELRVQRANLQMSLAAANDLYKYMSSGKRNALELAPNFEAFNDMLSTDIVKKIKDLQAERHDLLLRFTPEDESVKAVDMKLADLNGYLLESIRNTRENLTVKSHELDRAIAQAQGAFVGLPTREKNLTILQRDFQLNEKLYTFLREKETEAAIAKSSPTSYHRIIAEGLVPVEPASPHRTFVLVLAGFLGLLVGTALVYLLS
ncbi:MAG: hypothetical protein EOO56_24860, partial [Hymenobacter sp.]